MIALAAGMVAAVPASADESTVAGITYVTESQVISPGSNGGVFTAECPDGEHVLGGGFKSNAAFDDVILTHEWPDKFGGGNTFDGWTVAWNETVPTPVSATTYAICGEKAPAYAVKHFKIPPESRKARKVRCPDGRRVYAGGEQSAALNGYMVSTVPADLGSDSDEIPDDAWKATVDNYFTEMKLPTTVYAICGKEKLSYLLGGQVSGNGVQLATSITCSDDKPYVIGGGTKVKGGLNDTRISTSAPNLLSPDDEGWSSAVDVFADGGSLATYAVCIDGLD